MCHQYPMINTFHQLFTTDRAHHLWHGSGLRSGIASLFSAYCITSIHQAPEARPDQLATHSRWGRLFLILGAVDVVSACTSRRRVDAADHRVLGRRRRRFPVLRRSQDHDIDEGEAAPTRQALAASLRRGRTRRTDTPRRQAKGRSDTTSRKDGPYAGRTADLCLGKSDCEEGWLGAFLCSCTIDVD